MTVTSTDGPERVFRCGACETQFAKILTTGIIYRGDEKTEHTDTHYRQECDCNPCQVKMDPEKCGTCGKELGPGTVHVNCRRRIDLLEMRHPQSKALNVVGITWNPPVAKRRKK